MGVVDRIEKVRRDGDAGPDLEDRLYFIPSAPTNHLKMDPWWDGDKGEVKKMTDEIRGGMPAATLFLIPEAEIRQNRDGIKRWLGSGK